MQNLSSISQKNIPAMPKQTTATRGVNTTIIENYLHDTSGRFMFWEQQIIKI